MVKELTIATIGMDSRHRMLLQSLIRLHQESRRLNFDWLLGESVDAVSATATLQNDNADVVIVDVDSDAGRMAWYTMQAIMPGGLVVACTGMPKSIQASYVIAKPFGSGQEIVRLLNLFGQRLRLNLLKSS